MSVAPRDVRVESCACYAPVAGLPDVGPVRLR
jgi:hypothetical protein